MKPLGTIKVHDTTLGVWDDEVDKDRTMRMLRASVERLRTRGFKVEPDPHTKKHYAIISKWHYRGRRGDLEVKLRGAGRHVEITFFQNLSADNPNGGECDYDRFERMSRFMQREVVVVMAAIVRKLDVFNLELDRDLDANALTKSILHVASGRARAELTPLEIRRRESSFRFEKVDESGWPVPSEYDLRYNRSDRDRRVIVPGQTKYFRPSHGTARGYLMCGQAFPGGGNTWTVETGAGRFYVGNHELFDCERPDLEPRRMVPKQIERLEAELVKAVKAKAYRRVREIARAIERMQPSTKGVAA